MIKELAGQMARSLSTINAHRGREGESKKGMAASPSPQGNSDACISLTNRGLPTTTNRSPSPFFLTLAGSRSMTHEKMRSDAGGSCLDTVNACWRIEGEIWAHISYSSIGIDFPISYSHTFLFHLLSFFQFSIFSKEKAVIVIQRHMRAFMERKRKEALRKKRMHAIRDALLPTWDVIDRNGEDFSSLLFSMVKDLEPSIGRLLPFAKDESLRCLVRKEIKRNVVIYIYIYI